MQFSNLLEEKIDEHALSEITDPSRLQYETVLILQGGGSLGAYECGVYKSLAKHGIKFDITSGTSIGAINAAIIAANTDYEGHSPSTTEESETDGEESRVAKVLEDFWLTLAENSTPSFLTDSMRSIWSSMYAALYGNPRAFLPVWPLAAVNFFQYSPYLYDVAPLKRTLCEYIDFTKFNNRKRVKGGAPRLILSCTDIQKGEPVIFDSEHTEIDANHVVACAGFPFYGMAWTQIDGKYLWDGALLSNTPLREVINASPKMDKSIYIVNLFPHIQEQLPTNMSESWHRARDILYVDRTDHNVKMSKVISRYLALLRDMHNIINNSQINEHMKYKLKNIEQEYHKLACERGSIIREIIRIERKEESHFIFEDADFSVTTIKQLVIQGEKDADQVLEERKGREEPNSKADDLVGSNNFES